MEPPARLLRWRGLRGVREERQQINLLTEAGAAPDRGQLLDRLLRQSPLTDLLAPQRPAPRFEWARVTPYLRRPSLCRLVCHCYLEAGLEQVGPHLAQAFWRLVDDDAPGPGRAGALRAAIGLVCYLYAATAMVTGAEEPPLALPEDPTAALVSVLLASAGCGLLPPSAALAGFEIEERLGAVGPRAGPAAGRAGHRAGAAARAGPGGVRDRR